MHKSCCSKHCNHSSHGDDNRSDGICFYYENTAKTVINERLSLQESIAKPQRYINATVFLQIRFRFFHVLPALTLTDSTNTH